MPTPRLFFGRLDANVLLQADQGFADHTLPYDLLARGPRVAPAGVGGEAIFTTLYVVTTHFEDDVQLHITPYVDGVALEEQVILLPAGALGTEGEVRVHELALSVPHLVGGVEQLRQAPRGTWFQVRVETKYASGEGTPGAQMVDSIEVEAEVVREGDPAGLVAT